MARVARLYGEAVTSPKPRVGKCELRERLPTLGSCSLPSVGRATINAFRRGIAEAEIMSRIDSASAMFRCRQCNLLGRAAVGLGTQGSINARGARIDATLGYGDETASR